MKIRKRQHTVNTVEINGVEVEVDFQPHYEGDIFAEVVGDMLVVAYLVHDESPESPMEICDSQGKIYTAGQRAITDDSGAINRALGVGMYGDVDIDNYFTCKPYIDYRGIQQNRTCLRDIAAKQYLQEVEGDIDLIAKWLDERDFERDKDETYEMAFQERRNEIWQDLEDCNGVFCDEVEKLAIGLYPMYWKQIAGPFVVPMHYSSCSYDTTITPQEWDGDADDLPNCIWVADKNSEDNITPYPKGVSMVETKPYPEVLYAVMKDEVQVFVGSWNVCKLYIKSSFPAPDQDDLRKAAYSYAEAVAKEYASWCSGDVYGCVMQVYKKVYDQEGEDLDDFVWEDQSDKQEACWGFIGNEYALEALKTEYFAPTVASIKRENING